METMGECLLVLQQRQVRHVHCHKAHHVLVRVKIQYILMLQHLIVKLFLVDGLEDLLSELISRLRLDNHFLPVLHKFRVGITP
jgi:hypothetical protein